MKQRRPGQIARAFVVLYYVVSNTQREALVVANVLQEKGRTTFGFEEVRPWSL